MHGLITRRKIYCKIYICLLQAKPTGDEDEARLKLCSARVFLLADDSASACHAQDEEHHSPERQERQDSPSSSDEDEKDHQEKPSKVAPLCVHNMIDYMHSEFGCIKKRDDFPYSQQKASVFFFHLSSVAL